MLLEAAKAAQTTPSWVPWLSGVVGGLVVAIANQAFSIWNKRNDAKSEIVKSEQAMRRNALNSFLTGSHLYISNSDDPEAQIALWSGFHTADMILPAKMQVLVADYYKLIVGVKTLPSDSEERVKL